MKACIIGFGEAGPVFAKTLLDAGYQVTAFDILLLDPEQAQTQKQKSEVLGITAAYSLAEGLNQCDLIVSTVTASEATQAATNAAPFLTARAHWLDLNSVSPASKAAIRALIERSGASFTEGVAMDTVPSKGAQVPLLLCGPHADEWSVKLNQAGFNTRAISPEYGVASATKLIRSVIIKGFESLFAESMEAAAKLGVVDEVLASVQATYPELNWQQVAGYQLSRACLHAQRRAAEMREAASLLESLGVDPLMATASAARQQDLSDRQLGKHYQGQQVSDYVEALN